MTNTTASPDRAGLFAGGAADNNGDFTPGDWVLFGAISLIWGASFLLMAESLEAFTPGVVTLGRAGFGALVLGGFRASKARGHRIEPQDRSRVFLLAIVWVAIPFTLFPLAQQWINSAVAGLLNGATPVLVAVVSIFFVKVPPRSRQILGLALGFAGILLVSLGAAGEGSSQARGVLLVLLATLCYGFALNLAPPLQAKYGAVVLMSTVLGIAAVATVPYALVDLGDNSWAWRPALALLVVGAVGTGVAYWVMSTLVGRVGSIRASFITYVIPVVSLVLGVVFRGDTVSALAIMGAPLTIVGAFLASRKVT